MRNASCPLRPLSCPGAARALLHGRRCGAGLLRLAGADPAQHACNERACIWGRAWVGAHTIQSADSEAALHHAWSTHCSTTAHPLQVKAVLNGAQLGMTFSCVNRATDFECLEVRPRALPTPPLPSCPKKA